MCDTPHFDTLHSGLYKSEGPVRLRFPHSLFSCLFCHLCKKALNNDHLHDLNYPRSYPTPPTIPLGPFRKASSWVHFAISTVHSSEDDT